jgi:hypothetical protein
MAQNKALALLRYGNLLLIVDSLYNYREADFETMQYYYEQKACPHDYVNRSVCAVDLNDMNADPHGIFEFIGEIKRPDVLEYITSENIKELLFEHLEKLK